MVKRSLSQSAEEPIFLNWLLMRPPYSFFHSQQCSRNFSRPISCFVDALLFQHIG